MNQQNPCLANTIESNLLCYITSNDHKSLTFHNDFRPKTSLLNFFLCYGDDERFGLFKWAPHKSNYIFLGSRFLCKYLKLYDESMAAF